MNEKVNKMLIHEHKLLAFGVFAFVRQIPVWRSSFLCHLVGYACKDHFGVNYGVFVLLLADLLERCGLFADAEQSKDLVLASDADIDIDIDIVEIVYIALEGTP